MPSVSAARNLLVGAGATAGVLALLAGMVLWQTGGASAASTHTLMAAGQVGLEPAVTAPPSTSTSNTSSTSTSTTSTSTSSTTSTTVKPKPVTTTAPPRTTVPPVTTPPVTAAPLPPPPGTSPAERCAAARQWVAEHGLSLPAGWGFRCPGTAHVDGADRWGVACWNCEGTGSWIAVDIGRIGLSEATLRYVIAHETCHAIDYMGLGITTEIGADLCASVHGAPRP